MSIEVPNVYRISWQGKEPAGVPDDVRLFVPPVVGGHVLLPLQWLGLKRFRVIEVTPIARPSDETHRANEYAAELILEDS